LGGYYGDFERFLQRWTDVLLAGDPYYNPNLSRLAPWCPLRPPDEDERWLPLIGMGRGGSDRADAADRADATDAAG
jgi:hypothetical protein